MNQELKEQVYKELKELDEIFWSDKDETAFWKYEKQRQKYLNLIDSLIDKTVQVTEGRIVDNMLKVFSDNAKSYSGMKGELNASAIICIKDYCEAKGFITNKSELSTNKDEK